MELDSDLVDAIFEKVADGNFPNVAAISLGVTATQYENWMRRANAEMANLEEGKKLNKDEAIYVHLSTQIETAQAIAESRAVSFWQNHVSENWQAAKEFLSRRYPTRWSQNPQQDNPS
jgi:hypothetical protein